MSLSPPPTRCEALGPFIIGLLVARLSKGTLHLLGYSKCVLWIGQVLGCLAAQLEGASLIYFIALENQSYIDAHGSQLIL